MKRLLIFALLGPIIGLAIMLAVASFLSGHVIVPDARIMIYGSLWRMCLEGYLHCLRRRPIGI